MSVNMDTVLADIPEKLRRDVPRVVNRLLGQTFLYQDIEADKDDYYFVHRYRSFFENLIDQPRSLSESLPHQVHRHLQDVR